MWCASLLSTDRKQFVLCYYRHKNASHVSEQPGTEVRKGKNTKGKESSKCLRKPGRGDKRQAKHSAAGISKRRRQPRKKDTKETVPKQVIVLVQQENRRNMHKNALDMTDAQTTKRSTERSRKPAPSQVQRAKREVKKSTEKMGQKRTIATEGGTTRKKSRPRKDNCKQTDVYFLNQLIEKKRRTSKSTLSFESCSSKVDVSNSTKEKMARCELSVCAAKCVGEDGFNNKPRKSRLKQCPGREKSATESQLYEKYRCRRVLSRTPAQCEYCGLCLSNRDSLLFHIAAQHTNNRPFKCDHCGKSFVTKFKLKCHLNSKHAEDGRRFKCSECTYMAYDRRTLKVHQLTHTSEKPYKCSKCSDAFTRPYYLRTHMRTHTGEKPYECKACLRSFSQSSSLTRHQRKCQGAKSAGPHREQDQLPSAGIFISAMSRKTQGNVEIVLVLSYHLQVALPVDLV